MIWIQKEIQIQKKERGFHLIDEEILLNFKDEVKNFKQVCPKEMLDKLSNPITLKQKTSKAV